VDAVTLESAVFAAIATVMEKGDYPLNRHRSCRAGGQRDCRLDLGNGPLEQLPRDPEVSEIMVVRYVDRRR
jgi:Flp pilus assembly CpaF family ATPase